VPWPLSEATPALFSCSHSNLVFSTPLVRRCFATRCVPVFESAHVAGLPSGPRYLCAACTCGQAISSARIGEDEGSPAESEL